jgi:phospholipase C
MSTCSNWVTDVEIGCKDLGSKLDYECTSWADEGSNECSQWADQGHNDCQSKYYNECHWYSPWNCIAGWLCDAWYWVADWVCQAYYWVAKWVCKIFAWVEVHIFCGLILWGLVLFPLSLICLGLTEIKCALIALKNWVSPGGRPPARKIDHIFVLYLENRSFDHMLGFSGIRTGVDLAGQPTPFNEGFYPLSVTNNIDPNTQTAVATSTPAEYCLKGTDLDPGHEFWPTLTALCGEKAGQYDKTTGGYPPIDNSGFVLNYSQTVTTDILGEPTARVADPTRVMHCFGSRQLPVLNQLAREFAVCDQWFSSMPGPTEPNRLFAMAASSGGLDDSPSLEALQIAVATGFDGYEFENGSIFDLLEANCVSWRIFSGDDFPFSFIVKGTNAYRLLGRMRGFDDFKAEISEPDFGDRFVFIEPKYGEHTFDITGPSDFTCGNSMHPLDDVTRGEALIRTVYEAIRQSPHWERSMLIISFDEHGGFYDHCNPGPAVPPNDFQTDAYNQNGFKFDKLGVRVPAIVISPYTPRGLVDHTIYDHASMLATVERSLGLGGLTDRDKAASDVLKLLSLSEPRTDTPATLVSPAQPKPPLACEADDESTQERLLAQRSELIIAKRTGMYRDRPVQQYSIPPSHVPFLGIALRRALDGTAYEDRVQWLADFQAIRTGVDASTFMTEAKLKVKYGIDMKKVTREAEQSISRTRQV